MQLAYPHNQFQTASYWWRPRWRDELVPAANDHGG